MTPTFNFNHEIIRGDDVFEVVVEYTCTPFVAQTYWQPAEGGEVEIIDVQYNNKPFVVTDEEDDRLIAAAQNRAQGDYEDWASSDWEN